MSSPEILISEQCGTLGKAADYAAAGSNKVYRLTHSIESYPTSLAKSVLKLLRDIFLPHGYPDSVSSDYYEYQIWDTLQAFCSTISGTFTTQAVLKGVGVGSAQATPLAAAITWITKDGTGMVGRIIFAWIKGSSLDANCKKWRLFADFVNDSAMFLELIVPYCKDFTLHILCVTTAMKAVVGVAGGATRASITQHQAIKGNMGDVSAKDGSQETFVNLIASIVGIILLAVFIDGQYQWAFFTFFTLVHLIANYFAVSSLIFTHLNNTRLILVMRTYLKFDTVSNPVSLNHKEPVILGFGPQIKDLCAFNIVMGKSLKKITNIASADEVRKLTDVYKNKMYLLVPDLKKRIIYVAFNKDESSEDVLTAYFHAVLLAITTCNYNNLPLNLNIKRQLHHVTPLIRLNNAIKGFPKNESGEERCIPIQLLKSLDDFVNLEVTMFFTALKINGWSLDSHSLEVGEWRCKWSEQQGSSDRKFKQC